MNKKIFLEIGINIKSEYREIVIPTMLELGCSGFMETEDALYCYIDKDLLTKTEYENLKEDLKKLVQLKSEKLLINIREIAEENWNEKWERSIQPIEIGQRFVVVPSWCKYENKKDKIVLKIDPKMSFGTGFHETTRITLTLLEKHIKTGFNILDVGTGTGILAIAASKMGAVKSVGIDIDEWSVANAQENVIKNEVQNFVKIYKKRPEEIKGKFNIITSNLTLNTNIELLKEYSRLTESNGIIILSGFFKNDVKILETHLIKTKFSIKDIIYENEWSAISAIKAE